MPTATKLKSEWVGVRVSPRLMAELRAWASKHRRSLSDTVRLLIEGGLTHDGAKRP